MATINVAALLELPFSRRNFADKTLIVANGRPQPALPGLVSNHKDKNKEFVRHFSVAQYDKVSWLTGSNVENNHKLYCWPCLLFSNEVTVWNKQGFGNLNVLHNAIQKHEKSQNHLRCLLSLNTFGNIRIELQLDEQQRAHITQHNESVKKNRKILHRLIDAVCHLSKLELAFRGNDESVDSLNRGNYMETLDLISQYDPVLKSHLESATVFRGTSNRIQNDIIESVSNVVIGKMKQEIKVAPFIAILLDETSDVMNLSQMSTMFRYVNNKGVVEERFLGYTDMSSDKTALALYHHVVKFVENYEIKNKLIAQSYDGAAVMSGQISGLCTRVQETYPNAIFVHCFAHRLNLVLQQTCMNISECRLFFPTLSGLAAFFSKSPKRSEALKSFMTRKLPRVAPTRWTFNSRLINTVCEFLPQLIEFFEHIIDSPGEYDEETLVKSQGFLSFLTNCNTIFLLVAFSKLFGYTDILYNILQTKSFDISYCYQKVKDTKNLVDAERAKFEELWSDTDLKKGVCGIEEGQQRRRCRGGESQQDSARRVFYEIIDNISTQLTERFNTLDRFKFVQLLNPEQFKEFKQNFPIDILDSLIITYDGIFDYSRLKNELIVVYASTEFQNQYPHSLVQFMNDHKLDAGFPEVYKLACLYLTIPSTTASVERSFSTLKRIKTYIRATQGQERMSSLALLSIEKRLVCELRKNPNFYDDVINEFTKKERRMEFTYK